MAKSANVAVPAQTWTQLTSGNVSSITFQNIGKEHDMFVLGTVGEVAPTGAPDGAVQYNTGQGELNAAMTDLFPGVSGANRVYAWSEHGTEAAVNHA